MNSTRGHILRCRAESGGEVYYRNMRANKAKRAGQFIKPTFPLDSTLIDAIIHAKVQSRWTGRPLSDFNHPWLTPRQSSDEQSLISMIPMPPGSDKDEEAGSIDEEEKPVKGIILPPPAIPVGDQPQLVPPSLPSSLSSPLYNDVYVFWDVEDKHPSMIDPRVLAYRLKGIASSYGRLRGVYAYVTRKASNWVPDVLFEMAIEIKRKAEGEGGGGRGTSSSSESPSSDGGSQAALRWNRKLSESLQNSPNKSVGRIAKYHNSVGRPFSLKPGHQLSIRFVLKCEGMDVRLAQNALEDSGLAMAAGMAHLSAQIVKQSETREGEEGEGERNVVMVVVSDDVRLVKQLERLGKVGGGFVSSFVLISSKGAQHSSLAKTADVILGWDNVKCGKYIPASGA